MSELDHHGVSGGCFAVMAAAGESEKRPAAAGHWFGHRDTRHAELPRPVSLRDAKGLRKQSGPHMWQADHEPQRGDRPGYQVIRWMHRTATDLGLPQTTGRPTPHCWW